MSVEEVRPCERILASREADADERTFLWIIIASCLVHVALAFVITISPRTRRINAPSEVVSVEILAPEEFETLSGGSEQGLAVTPEARTAPAANMIHATRLYAAAVLADPGSRQAREALPTLREDERILQLCNLEAMEQVRRWRTDFEPEFVVAYATAEVEIGNDSVRAGGGAFRSHDHWYNIRFECAVSPDHERVVDFAFSVGAEIPASQWASHGLPTEGGPDD